MTMAKLYDLEQDYFRQNPLQIAYLSEESRTTFEKPI